MNTLNLIIPVDYIILVITLVFMILSAWKGLIQSILGLMTWLGSIIITLYSYKAFSIFLSNQILKINFFQNYEMITNVLGIILSIPIIFLISLFILKKIRQFISSDLDKQILGIIIDKTFGLLYGLIFSYLIYSTVLFSMDSLNLESLNKWTLKSSEILNSINNINEQYIYRLIPSIQIKEL